MRCALYFGSFNPLHKGHIAIAKYVMENCNVDSVRLVLSPQSPFKDSTILQDPTQRLEELQKSIARFNKEYAAADEKFQESEGTKKVEDPKEPNIKKLEISTVEFNLPRPNYTYNTLQYLKKLEPQNTFLLVMGADNLAVIEKWYKGLEILQEFEVLVYPRTGFDTMALCKKYGATYLNAPLNNISSTMIREGEKSGRDMSNFRY